MFTYTETPLKDIWEHLKFLAVENNCKRLLNGEIKSNRPLLYTDKEVVRRKSKEISLSIKQAFEYFKASEESSIHTSPLIIFYGMLSLSKALIVANEEEIFLDNIKYHGLETRPRYDYLKDYSDKEEDWMIEREYAVTNEGVFSYLLKIFDDYAFDKQSVIEFKDILKCVPQLWGVFEKYYGESPTMLNLYSYKEMKDPKYELVLNISGKDPTHMLKTIPELEADFIIGEGLLHEQAKVFTSKDINAFPKYLGISSPQVGGQYLIKGLRFFNGENYQNHFLSIESLDYIAMYILSICVRYKQVLWGQVISGESSGILSLIELYINSIKRRFPNKILDTFFNEKFVYGTIGYF
jgi:hypothetical protein